MSEKAYQPKSFDSIGPEPVAPAEKVGQSVPVTEAAPVRTETASENVFSRGEERFQKSGNFLNALKAKSVSFFSKIPQVVGAWKQKIASGTAEGARAAAIGVLSTPELAAEGARAVAETGGAIRDSVEGGAAAAMQGFDKFGESVNSGIDAAAMGILDGGEAIAQFARTKKEQFDTNVQNRIEAAKEVADLAGNWTAEKATQARESVNSGIRNVTEWGANSLAAANAKRLEAINNYRQQAAKAKLDAFDLRLKHHEAEEKRHQEAQRSVINQKVQFMASAFA